MERRRGGEWAELTPDLLRSIGDSLHSFKDRVALRGVCKSWRSIAITENFITENFVPWLMHSPDGTDFRGFTSLTEGGMVHRLELPEARGRRCITTSLGWLITVADESQDFEMELLHPFSRFRIPLPSLRNRKYWGIFDTSVNRKYWDTSDRCLNRSTSIHRAALSASPSKTDDYVLVIILGQHYFPAFWKPGNNGWTVIERPRHPFGLPCRDVIYFKDHFYVVNGAGDLLLCDLNSQTAKIVRHVSVNKPTVRSLVRAYLVECDGELIGVNVAINSSKKGTPGNYYTECDLRFRVFKFDSTNMNNWQDSNDLGGRSVFLGEDSVATAVAPSAAAGTKPNCIYFTDGGGENKYVTISPTGGNDKGFFCPSFCTEYKYDYSTHIWFVPSFF